MTRLSGKMQKLSYANKDEYPEVTKDIHANSLPEGWREITSEEFSQSVFFTHLPEFVEYRQMYAADDSGKAFVGSMIEARLFHFWDGTGVAMRADYWKKEIHYYKFGCEHKYNELDKDESEKRGYSHYGMCWHVYECATCGHTMSQDSSD